MHNYIYTYLICRASEFIIFANVPRIFLFFIYSTLPTSYFTKAPYLGVADGSWQVEQQAPRSDAALHPPMQAAS